MTTALLVLALILVVGVLLMVIHQCFENPFMGLLHLCLGTIGQLVELIGYLIAAIAGANGGSGGSSGGSS